MLLKCQCGHSFGVRQGSRASCSRCGESDKITTTAVFSDSARLAQAVATANLPTEIRAEVESKVKKENLRREASRERAGINTIHRILRDSTDIQGILTIARLRDNLAAEGISEPTAEQVVGSAEEEGVVHRSGQDQWRWLA